MDADAESRAALALYQSHLKASVDQHTLSLELAKRVEAEAKSSASQ